MRRLFLIAALVAGLLTTAIDVRGDAIYTTLPSGFFDNEWVESGPQSINGAVFQMFQFTATTGGVLGSIEAAAEWEGSGANQGHIVLASDSGGLPGAVIESIDVSNFPGLSHPDSTLVTASSVLHPTLDAGSRYWFGLLAGDNSYLYLGFSNATGTVAQQFNGGSWTYQSASNQGITEGKTATFELDTESVVAPSPFSARAGIALLGFVGIAIGSRRFARMLRRS